MEVQKWAQRYQEVTQNGISMPLIFVENVRSKRWSKFLHVGPDASEINGAKQLITAYFVKQGGSRISILHRGLPLTQMLRSNTHYYIPSNQACSPGTPATKTYRRSNTPKPRVPPRVSPERPIHRAHFTPHTATPRSYSPSPAHFEPRLCTPVALSSC